MKKTMNTKTISWIAAVALCIITVAGLALTFAMNRPVVDSFDARFGALADIEASQPELVTEASKTPVQLEALPEVEEAVAEETTTTEETEVAEPVTSTTSAPETTMAETAAPAQANVEAAPATYTRTLIINGSYVPYADSFKTTGAPENNAGLWLGNDSTTDGSFGYFIGHNPGDFTCLLGVSNGSQVTVWDSNSNSRTYTIHDIFEVNAGTTWEQIESRVATHGESIILQTCINGGKQYRVHVAY